MIKINRKCDKSFFHFSAELEYVMQRLQPIIFYIGPDITPRPISTLGLILKSRDDTRSKMEKGMFYKYTKKMLTYTTVFI